MEVEIPLDTVLSVSCPKGSYSGHVRYCVYREIGYFVGVQFEMGSKWTQRQFKPMHLFDPRGLSD